MGTVDDVRSIIDELRDGWWTVLDLMAYREMWHQLDPSLRRYPGTSAMLREVYEHAMLAGCRRLVDHRNDTRSVWRALDRLHRIAPQVGADVLAQTRRGDGSSDLDMLLEIAQDNLAMVNGDGGRAGHLVKRRVREDRAELDELHTDVIRLANELTAHSAEGGITGSVEEWEIAYMLDHVLAVVQRWVALLEGVGLSSTPPRHGDARAATKALDLFDWREYQLARGEQERAIGPRITPEDIEWIDANAQVRYVWPDRQ